MDSGSRLRPPARRIGTIEIDKRPRFARRTDFEQASEKSSPHQKKSEDARNTSSPAVERMSDYFSRLTFQIFAANLSEATTRLAAPRWPARARPRQACIGICALVKLAASAARSAARIPDSAVANRRLGAGTVHYRRERRRYERNGVHFGLAA